MGIAASDSRSLLAASAYLISEMQLGG